MGILREMYRECAGISQKSFFGNLGIQVAGFGKLCEKVVGRNYGKFRDFGFYYFQTEQEKVENVFLGVLEELSHEEENKERLKK